MKMLAVAAVAFIAGALLIHLAPPPTVAGAERLQPPPAVCSIKDMQDGDGGPVTITAVDERGWYAEAGDGRFKLFANSDMGLIGMLCGWLREDAAP